MTENVDGICQERQCSTCYYYYRHLLIYYVLNENAWMEDDVCHFIKLKKLLELDDIQHFTDQYHGHFSNHMKTKDKIYPKIVHEDFIHYTYGVYMKGKR